MSINKPENLAGQQFHKPGETSEQTKPSNTAPNSAQIENKNLSTSNTSPGAATASQTANEPKSTIERSTPEVVNRASEVIEQTKQIASDTYDKTIKVAADTYDRTMSYGKQNPGTLTLIAFGAGVGIGLLLAGGFSSHSRANNLIEPAANLLTTVAKQFFR